METIKTINKPTEWFRRIRAGETLCGRLRDPFADQSFSVQLSHYNARRGRERNIFIHYHYCRSKEVMVIVCVTREEYLNEKKQIKYAENWRDRIPPKYRDN